MLKIRIVKPFPVPRKVLRIGDEFEARILASVPFQFGAPFQIIDGEHSGVLVPREHAIEVDSLKRYTEKEWNDLENHYLAELDREREKYEKAHELVKGLTEKINLKNSEIEKLAFYVDALSKGLVASCKAIEVLRETK